MKSLLVSFFVSFLTTVGFAQQAIIPSGAQVLNSSGSIEYSLGQLFFMSHSTSFGNINEGIQQPSQEVEVIAKLELKDAPMKVEVFPNPSEGLININIKTAIFSSTSYSLRDSKGRIIEQNVVRKRGFVIDLTSREPAFYLLEVSVDGHNSVTTRILKN